MTSQVNPYNIDGTYPVAGQDNDSQGFRDNFTNTRNNFAFVKSELEDLQSKVLLKAPLNNTTLDNDLSTSGTTLNNAQLTAFSETYYNNGSLSGSQTINYNQGNYQRITTGGSLTVGFSNWPTAGVMGRLILWVNVTSTAYTLTLPAQVTLGFPTEIAGVSSNIVTFDATGDYLYEFISSDYGASYFCRELTRAPNKVHGKLSVTGELLLASSEDLAASAAASLVKTASYFSTATAETATLAAGTDGQIKTFMMAADTGDMVITVTNAGWKTSGTGTITFDTIGDACTLQYVNSKWYCIGNNGAVFA
jgi:hypothetical protein